MVKKLPSTDVVVVGLGWAGSIIANELADEGLRVIGFERGPWRDTATDFNVASAADELRYNRRQDLMLRTRQNTTTIRNNVTETALPMRSELVETSRTPSPSDWLMSLIRWSRRLTSLRACWLRS